MSQRKANEHACENDASGSFKLPCSSMIQLGMLLACRFSWHGQARPSQVGLAWLCPVLAARTFADHTSSLVFVMQTRQCWYKLAWLGCAKTPAAHPSSLVLCGADAAAQVPARLARLCRDSCCSHQPSGVVWCRRGSAGTTKSCLAVPRPFLLTPALWCFVVQARSTGRLQTVTTFTQDTRRTACVA